MTAALGETEKFELALEFYAALRVAMAITKLNVRQSRIDEARAEILNTYRALSAPGAQADAGLGALLARQLFECGDEPNLPTFRIEFKAKHEDGEVGLGGFAEAPLARFLQSLIDAARATEAKP